MRSIRLPIPLLTMVALLALPLAGAAATAAPSPSMSTPAAGFVGSEICVSCHSPEAERLAGTPHGKGKFATLSAHGCETCHGPAARTSTTPKTRRSSRASSG